MSIGEIAREYDLTLPEIRAALEYYADHRTEIDEAIQAEQAFIAEMRQRHPSKLASNLKLRSGD
jgi:DNA-binding transcriptional MerR regulator